MEQKKKESSLLRTRYDRNGTCDKLAETNCSSSRDQFPWILKKQKEESGSFLPSFFFKLT